jgi:bifunctional ADP-heptose synthase (sugar kinase/adenylyltransferase)
MLVEILDQFKDLRVALIGETILDEFIPVKYQGQSMKSFCPVFELTSDSPQKQIGGTGAIERHLRDFVKDVTVFTNDPESIVKTRYLDLNSGQKHLEFNRFQKMDFAPINIDTRDYDVVIVADFGHGFCDHLSINDGFHLMCQTNSNNFGFNRLSKWKSKTKRSVCLDLREASLQINHRISDCSDSLVKELYDYELNTEHLFITLGQEGALFTDGHQIQRKPSFETEIVDTIGAGDAFYSFSCLCSALELEDRLSIPSLAASLTTTWLCNEKEVTRKNILEHANKYL